MNIDVAGANYGWPVITFGREYVTGFRIGEGSVRADVTPPRHQWTPSIAPSAWLSIAAHCSRTGRAVFVGSPSSACCRDCRSMVMRWWRRSACWARSGIASVMRQGPEGALYLLDETAGSILRFHSGALNGAGVRGEVGVRQCLGIDRRRPRGASQCLMPARALRIGL